MNKISFVAICIVALMAAHFLRQRNTEQPVTIFAASSLREVLDGICNQMLLKEGWECHTQYEASSTLARQIKEGAPADLFITAAPEWLDKLEAIRVLERVDWLSNRLVCVVHKDVDVSTFDLRTLDSLALAGDQVPAGKYAKAALDHMKIALPGRVIYGSSVRDVLSKVSKGGAKAGIVYATDALIDPDLRVAFTFPGESHPKIIYAVGLLTPRGKPLFDALRAPSSLDSASRYGFTRLQ